MPTLGYTRAEERRLVNERTVLALDLAEALRPFAENYENATPGDIRRAQAVLKRMEDVK